MENSASRLSPLAATIHTTATSLPAPTGVSDGQPLPNFAAVGMPILPKPRDWDVSIKGSVALTIGGPVWLCLWDGTTWWKCLKLNGGQDITIQSATFGFIEKVRDIGWATRACLYSEGSGLSAGNVTVALTPYEVVS